MGLEFTVNKREKLFTELFWNSSWDILWNQLTIQISLQDFCIVFGVECHSLVVYGPFLSSSTFDQSSEKTRKKGFIFTQHTSRGSLCCRPSVLAASVCETVSSSCRRRQSWSQLWDIWQFVKSRTCKQAAKSELTDLGFSNFILECCMEHKYALKKF